jgi:autotransporter-associated beta strand protein
VQAGTISAVLAGTGNLLKTTNSIITLSGLNSYTGTTHISGGTISASIANSLSASSSFVLDSGTTLDIGGFNQTVGSLSGQGTVSNFGLADAIISVGNDNTDSTFSGIIQDDAATGLSKIGSGTLILTGNNTYTGQTRVLEGTLIVNGSISNSSELIVNSNGTIGGSGYLPTTTLNGATLAPGNIENPLHISGNLIFNSAATYQVNVTPNSSDRVEVSGSASLNGNVVATFSQGNYTQKQYIILKAANGIGGTTFSSLTTVNLPSKFSAKLLYSGDIVSLDLTAQLGLSSPNFVNFPTNQFNVATAINNYFNKGGLLPPSITNLFALPDNNLWTALSSVSGESATGVQAGSFKLSSQYLLLMTTPISESRIKLFEDYEEPLTICKKDDLATRAKIKINILFSYCNKRSNAPLLAGYNKRWNVWSLGFGINNRTSGDPLGAGSHNISMNIGGYAVGGDYRITRDAMIGFSLAGGATNWSLSGGLGGGHTDAMLAGVYAFKRFGKAYISAAAAFTNHWAATQRTSFANDSLNARFNAQNYSGRIETGIRASTSLLNFTPYFALQSQLFTKLL